MIEEVERVVSDTTKSSCDRYRGLYDLIRTRDKEMARGFDDFRRSTALQQVAIIRSLDLWTDEEYAEFSIETRNIVAFFISS